MSEAHGLTLHTKAAARAANYKEIRSMQFKFPCSHMPVIFSGNKLRCMGRGSAPVNPQTPAGFVPKLQASFSALLRL
jgi:hypothetical protein